MRHVTEKELGRNSSEGIRRRLFIACGYTVDRGIETSMGFEEHLCDPDADAGAIP